MPGGRRGRDGSLGRFGCCRSLRRRRGSRRIAVARARGKPTAPAAGSKAGRSSTGRSSWVLHLEKGDGAGPERLRPPDSLRAMRRAGLAALLFLACGTAAAQGPAADWRTVETAHFRIHYPAPFAAWALHAAGEIEAIHARVTDYVGYVPARRIEVVVADPLANANGTAVPFLDRPEILLWTSAPESESSIGDYGDWMELVATHEIAHIVHLARPRNRSSAVLVLLSPAPFGPLALASPEWVTEGYATIVEGALTGSGRPGSSFRAMVLRQLAIEGKLPDYGDLDGAQGWLGGAIPYLVGSAYLEWLSDRDGKDALPRLWKRMASSRGGGFLVGVQGHLRRFAGDPLRPLPRRADGARARGGESHEGGRARRGRALAASVRRDAGGAGVAGRDPAARATGSHAQPQQPRRLGDRADRRGARGGRGAPPRGRRARARSRRDRGPARGAGAAQAGLDAAARERTRGVGSALDAGQPRGALLATRARGRRHAPLGPVPVESRGRPGLAPHARRRRERRGSVSRRRMGRRGPEPQRGVAARARGPRDRSGRASCRRNCRSRRRGRSGAIPASPRTAGASRRSCTRAARGGS